MRNVLYVAIVAMVALTLVGCPEQKPAKVERPAEPAFVAQTLTVPAAKVASIAKLGPYSGVGDAVAELFKTLEAEKITPNGMPYGVYFDNPTQVKPESCKYEVCVQVAPETKNKADKKTGFAIKDAPEMLVAATEYMGPYDKVAPVYEKLFKWVGENKLVSAGPMIEWYLSDPAKTKPESLMARVAAVVKPAAPAAESPKTDSSGKPPRTGRGG